MTSLSAYTDSVRKKGWPVAGYLIWYAVSEDICIDHEALKKAMETHGLAGYAPKAPRDDDVFRRVCTLAQRKREPVPSKPDTFENYLVRDVKADSGNYWKQIVVETVDSGNRRLDYQPAVELHFDPSKPDKIHVKGFVRRFHAVSAVIDDIVTSYQHWRGKVHSYTFRETVREIVSKGSNALLVKSTGGIYFVPSDRMDLIDGLDRLVQAAPWQVGSVELSIVPLIDDQRQREMVKKAFEEEAVADLTKLTHECMELLAGDAISDRKFAACNRKLREAEARVSEYQTILEDSLDSSTLHLKSAKAKMVKLYQHVG